MRTPTDLKHGRARTQSGAALMVALVILVALTLLGLAAMSGNTLQQKMAYGAAQTDVAFQAAETGLTLGEYWLEDRLDQPVAGCAKDCAATDAIWPGPVDHGPPAITVADFRNPAWWATEGRVSDQVLAGVAQQPQYVIEELGRDPGASVVLGGPKVITLWYYRVTARGIGADADGPATLVQSVYTKGF